MNTANNQLRRETDRRLKEALLTYREEGKEPGVGELCKAVSINRSTFYRHYLDVFDLMERTEAEMQMELLKTTRTTVSKPFSKETLLPVIEYIGTNRRFYRQYLKTHMDVSVETGMHALWDSHLKPVFLARGVTNETHMRYYYQSFRTAMMSMLRLWLERDCTESPDELSQMMIRALIR